MHVPYEGLNTLSHGVFSRGSDQGIITDNLRNKSTKFVLDPMIDSGKQPYLKAVKHLHSINSKQI